MADPGVMLLVKLSVLCYLVKLSPAEETSINETRGIPNFRQIYPPPGIDSFKTGNWSNEEIGTRIFSLKSMRSASFESVRNEAGCIDNGIPCLPLCCGVGMFKDNRVCVKDDNSDLNETVIIVEGKQVTSANYQFAVSDLCDEKDSLVRKDHFHLREDGSVYLPRSGSLKKKAYNFGDYCLWRDQNSTITAKYATYVPKLCTHDLNETEETSQSTTLERVGLILSLPFLLATFIVYTILPDLRNVPGNTLRGYVGCLAMAFVFLSIIKNVRIESKFLCTFTGYTALFSSLASYFWLNIMCIDIWRTFGRSQTRQRHLDLSDRDTYIVYSAYAWSCPILITGACLIMDQIPGIPRTILRPGFGDYKCWFRTDQAMALYFYGPVGVTVFANILMFVTTVIKMSRYQKKSDRHFRSGESKRHNKEQALSYHLYVKLFLVMGISWFMEIIAWLCKSQILWYVTDTVNTLQGLTIFIVLVWTDKIKRMLAKHWSVNKVERTSTRLLSSSSPSKEPDATISGTSSNSLESG